MSCTVFVYCLQKNLYIVFKQTLQKKKKDKQTSSYINKQELHKTKYKTKNTFCLLDIMYNGLWLIFLLMDPYKASKIHLRVQWLIVNSCFDGSIQSIQKSSPCVIFSTSTIIYVTINNPLFASKETIANNTSLYEYFKQQPLIPKKHLQ